MTPSVQYFSSHIPLPNFMPDLAEFTTTEDAARKLDFHVISVRRLLRENELDGVKIGRTWLVSKSSIQKYLERTRGLSKNDPNRSSKISQ
ncbi:MAG TPA: helix-turn-helix domain-containing protein [Anaerolineales bacterium]|nr:helix-turn-helix domain-containing protein [Anaerolineales bacterium]